MVVVYNFLMAPGGRIIYHVLRLAIQPGRSASRHVVYDIPRNVLCTNDLVFRTPWKDVCFFWSNKVKRKPPDRYRRKFHSIEMSNFIHQRTLTEIVVLFSIT